MYSNTSYNAIHFNYFVHLLYINIYIIQVHIFQSLPNLIPETPKIQVLLSMAYVTSIASRAFTDSRTFFSLPTRFVDSLELSLWENLNEDRYMCMERSTSYNDNYSNSCVSSHIHVHLFQPLPKLSSIDSTDSGIFYKWKIWLE